MPIFFILLLVLYISGKEAKEASEVNFITVARKPEETWKQGYLLCKPETLGLTPTLPHYSVSVLGSFTCTTNPSTQDLQLNVPSEGQGNYGKVS